MAWQTMSLEARNLAYELRHPDSTLTRAVLEHAERKIA